MRLEVVLVANGSWLQGLHTLKALVAEGTGGCGLEALVPDLISLNQWSCFFNSSLKNSFPYQELVCGLEVHLEHQFLAPPHRFLCFSL